MFAFALQSDDNGLTLHEVIADIPHDVASLVIYVMVAVFLFLIWYGSRAGSGPDAGPPAGDGGPSPKQRPAAR
jgi:hypothetical protein